MQEYSFYFKRSLRGILGIIVFFLPFLGQAHKDTCVCVPSFAPIVEKVLPAVVDISAKKKVSKLAHNNLEKKQVLTASDNTHGSLGELIYQWTEGYTEEETPDRHNSLGAGFVIDKEGYIVTNRHVIQDAEEVIVSFHNGEELPAKIVGRDKRTDLALLKVDAKTPLSFLTWSDSHKARVGDWILVVGSPFGFGRSVSAGIISARGRDLSRSSISTLESEGIASGYVDDLIQTDAAINLGNSGGPMVDTQGHVLGVNVAIFSPSGGSVGIGFAVSAAVAAHTIEQMKEKGKVQYGWIGVHVQEITPEIAKILGLSENIKGGGAGALVSLVVSNGPAAKAGLHPSDIILTFDGKLVANYEKFPRLVGETSIGKKVPMEILRRGKKLTLTVEVAEMPQESVLLPEEPSSLQSSENKKSEEIKDLKAVNVIGIILSPLSAMEAKKLSIATKNAFLIQGIQSFSKALNQPLILSNVAVEPGDILIEVNHQSFHSLEELQALLNKIPSDQSSASLTVSRGGQSHTISLPLGGTFYVETEEEGKALLLIETKTDQEISSPKKKK